MTVALAGRTPATFEIKSANLPLVALLLNLILGVMLIPPLGLIGAALSTASSWAVAHVWLATIVSHKLGIRPDILRAITLGMRHLVQR